MKNRISIVQTTLPGDLLEPEVGEWVFSKISDKLAKCAHRIRVQSMYQWDEKIEFCPEWRIQFKTNPEMKSELIRAIQSDHPYDVPQILAWDADSTEDYFNWVQG